LKNLFYPEKSHEMLSKLFSPVKYREIEFRNRIFVSPMCQYSAMDGVPNDWHFVHLGSRAVGGAGLVMAEATAVSQEGQISPNDLGIWNNIQAEAFKKITAFISSQGAIPGIQLAHAGRKASTAAPWHGGKLVKKAEGGWETFAPSPLPFSPDYSLPHELTLSEIEELILKFTDATNRAKNSGFKVIELHMAHGYLLHEFLSPVSNHRQDEYGGDLAGRMKLPLKLAKAVRETFPNDFPVFVRISVTDWVDNGWDLPQSIIFAKELKKIGIDLVDCSSGGQVPDAKIPVGIGYQVPFSSAIRKEAGISTGAVGLITNAQQAEQIIGTGSADVVFMAREMLRDPYWPLHAAHELGVDVPWPVQYRRAKR
jgi:2,4-dienoyl-CoA reductase-like NADH-dependent reductase (Old Yellow Enzyme family)